ncbi:VWA domain-containing protein [Halobiforma nitratireducens]|uniref:Protporphyrin IX magnesium chelatase n=1 Tax=Halobiforma nitratireducens JCM 10879 TaxID=1227454 RepID=M0M9Z1_9EURY|nr:VWA domain-containing protein [Halobiforma nitratireducens]EMA42602.1 protporphyrin IX magnesium chelatase [Halobiforma nitratireducens JCM 10879]
MVANAGDKKLSSLPFPAIVGQRELKRVLLAVAANDDLDGALIAGEKGTAKSTAVRGLVDLLPEQRAVADCPYGCAPDEPSLQCESCRDRDREDVPVETRPVPLVTLPLGATRDRVVGTLSVEDALAGEADFDPGLLARAHRGLLYVDEVNLLDDHLVDVLLDAAASGVNRVERDGVSVSHPAEFTLIGTMNPEEGELRPQLRDRFALRATVAGCRDVEDRVTVVDRVLERSSDDSSPDSYRDEVDSLRADLRAARERLPGVTLPDEFKTEIAELCLEAGVDGHRGDVAIARTAMTLAALEGRTTVIEGDVREAAGYALPHRLRSTPFEETPALEDLLEERFDEDGGDDGERENDGEADEGADGDGDGDGADGSANDDETPTEREAPEPGDDAGAESDGDGPVDDGDASDTDDGQNERDGAPSPSPSPSSSGELEPTDDDAVDPPSSPSDGNTDDGNESDGDPETAAPIVPGQRRPEIGQATAPNLDTPEVDDGSGDAGGSRRSSATSDSDARGPRVRTERASPDDRIDAAASVRAAATRGDSSVEEQDLRRSIRTDETAATIVFAVDASASMRPAMRTAKGVVLELLRDSYQQRDRVAFVAFAGDDAEVLLPPTDSVSLAARHLKDLPTGDRTPLPAGLETTARLLRGATTDAAVVVLVTDGRANVADGSPTKATRRAARELAATGTRVLVVDAGEDARGGVTGIVAEETDGRTVPLSGLSREAVRTAVERAGDDG